MRLDQSFYQRHDPLQISRELLGKTLVTQFDGIRTAGIIVETEAYRAPDDSACHAHLNRFTERTRTMFAAGGAAYIYLCYGIHHLFNIVTADEGMAHVVLVRAIEPTEGIETMLLRRNLPKLHPRVTAGPGAMSQALGMHKQFNGTSLLDPDGMIWLEDHHLTYPDSEIAISRRIGVENSGISKDWDWRFYVRNNPYVSARYYKWK